MKYLTLAAILLVAEMVSASTPSPTPTAGAVISGAITYGDTSMPVPNVALFARRSDGNYVMTTSNAQGFYELHGFIPVGIYTVRPMRNGLADAAVSSYDAALIGKFAVGNISFTAIQRLAADVSLDGVVTSFDAALAQAYAVGNGPEPPRSLWVFSPSAVLYTDIIFDIVNENYKAIILGDVSQSWTLPVPSPSPTVSPNPLPSPTNACPPAVCGRG